MRCPTCYDGRPDTRHASVNSSASAGVAPIAVQKRRALNDGCSASQVRAFGPTVRTCHTAQLANFILEGHVPAPAIQRLLLTKPANVSGLAVPGMPMGHREWKWKARNPKNIP